MNAAATIAPLHYIPAHDARFRDDVVNYLIERRGLWCHPGRAVLDLRGHDTCDATDLAVATYKAVQAARRLGFTIKGDRRLGYRFLYWRCPLYARTMETQDDDGDEVPPEVYGQMSIEEALP